MKKYNPQQIEKKWQKFWEDNQTFVAQDKSAKPKKYVLIEFPYPSGEGLHMGHLRPYVAGDVFARYNRLRGFETMYPMGWDAFGLPAENFALKKGVHPSKTTAENMANAKRQVKSWGIGFDWSREINTTDPHYYRWTQWIFLQFYKAGLAYEATGLINWCPKDKTGLANEEVIDGRCERCGTIVEKKEMKQWYLKITAYAEKLLAGLKTLNKWPEAVKLQQENWIGKSTGAEIEFPIKDLSAVITVFTTRPDTIFGATYMVLAPEHPLLEALKDKIDNWTEVQKYIDQARKKTEIDRTAEGKEKTGVELKGIKAVNPATKEEIPVWIADYVLGSYGTGAIMAVPAHDQRDFEFARKYQLAIKHVIAPETGTPRSSEEVRPGGCAVIFDPETQKYAFGQLDNGVYWLYSGGIEPEEDMQQGVLREVTEESGLYDFKHVELLGHSYSHYYNSLKKLNRIAEVSAYLVILESVKQKKLQLEDHEKFKLVWTTPDKVIKDWAERNQEKDYDHWIDFMRLGVSRAIESGYDKTNDPKVYRSSAYEGTGRLVNSGKFDGMASAEAIPKMAEVFGKPTVQYKLRDWVFSRQRYWGEPIPIIHCEQCGIVPVPEEQLPVKLPQVEKYEPTGTGESPLAAIEEWVNVKCPNCDGPAKRETNTMPQWAGSSWYYLRYTDPQDDKVFAAQDLMKYWLPVDVYFGGMEHTTLHLLYSRFWNLFLYDQGLVPVSEPYTQRVPHGIVLAADGEKMSKSRGNVVNPDDIVKSFGADTLRMYELFLGPHEMTVSWNDQGIIGVKRFLDRVWAWVHDHQNDDKNSEVVERELHKLIKKVTADIEAYRFNTAIAAFMQFHNAIKDQTIGKESMIAFLRLLYPFAPHVSEELHELLGGSGSLQNATWPEFNAAKVVEETVQMIVQVNGKMRDKFRASLEATEDELKQQALSSAKVSAALGGKQPTKIIVVPGRLVSIVI